MVGYILISMGSTWPFILMYRSCDIRHTGFRRLTVVNGTPRNWGVTGVPEITQILLYREKKRDQDRGLVRASTSWSLMET